MNIPDEEGQHMEKRKPSCRSDREQLPAAVVVKNKRKAVSFQNHDLRLCLMYQRPQFAETADTDAHFIFRSNGPESPQNDSVAAAQV